MLQSGELLVPRKAQEEAGVPLVTFVKDILVRMAWGVVGELRCHEGLI